jgi:hypothetical protein
MEAADYRTYLTRLEQAAAEGCRLVLKLKSAVGDATAEPGCDPVRVAPAGPVSFPDESTEDEKIAALDRQLGSSMSEFDELLLREMDELKRRQASAPDDVAESGGTAGGGQEGGQQDENAERGAQTGRQGSGGQGDEQRQGGEQTASRTEGSGPQGGAHGGNEGGREGATKPSGRDEPPDEGDDDIVARQLREAAENEADPVLREKLWEEYRRYKSANSNAGTAKSRQ